MIHPDIICPSVLFALHGVWFIVLVELFVEYVCYLSMCGSCFVV